MKKPTLREIATAAKAGTATVERVLNGRGGVSVKTAEKIVRAAKALGYDRPLPERHRGAIRIEVVMVRPDTPFFSRLNAAFERIAASLDSSIFVHRTFVAENDPAGVARHLGNPALARSGLIIIVPDHALVRAALARLKADGVDIVHIVSRGRAPDDVFVGIDNYAAGRTAAFHMSAMLRAERGHLVALCHSGAYEVHKERIRGFSDYIAAHPMKGQSFSEVMFGFDDDVLSAEIFEKVLRRTPDVIGIYNAGGANRAVASVLQRRAPAGRMLWIGHELTPETRTWLATGLMTLVFDQAPEVQARRALDTVLKRLGVIDVEVSEEPIRFLTISAENL